MRFEDIDLPFEERWENLTLANDFMFGKVFQDLDLCLELVRLILPELDIERITLHERQKAVHETMDTHGVRFDVYLHDNEGRIIIVEMQVANRKYLPRRTRAYHSAADIDARKNGAGYGNMPEVIVIFICAFDPFGLGRHVYTFRKMCVEERDLVLDDGATTIFLNTKGKDDGISPRLKAFLDMVGGKSSDDEFVQRLERRLRYAKQNWEWRQEYMLTAWERDTLYNEGVEEGIVIGEKRGIHQANIATARNLRNMGMNDTQINLATGLSFEDISRL